MILESNNREEVAIVRLSGDISEQDARTIRNEVRGLLSLGRRRIVLLLDQVNHISLFAVGSFAERRKEAQAVMAEIKIAGMNERLAETFSTFGMAKALDLYLTEEEACRSFVPVDGDPGRLHAFTGEEAARVNGARGTDPRVSERVNE